MLLLLFELGGVLLLHVVLRCALLRLQLNRLLLNYWDLRSEVLFVLRYSLLLLLHALVLNGNWHRCWVCGGLLSVGWLTAVLLTAI